MNRRWEAWVWQQAAAYEAARKYIMAGWSKPHVKAAYAKTVGEAWERLWKETP